MLMHAHTDTHTQRDTHTHASVTAHGGGGSFKDRKPIGEFGCAPGCQGKPTDGPSNSARKSCSKI